MTIVQALTSVFSGNEFQAAVLVVILDVILGTAAAFKSGTFRLSYFADFARNDIVFKLLPWVAFAIAAKFAGDQQIIPYLDVIDLGVVAGSVYAAAMLAWASSILNSMKELGFPVPDIPGRNTITGDENAAPPKD